MSNWRPAPRPPANVRAGGGVLSEALERVNKAARATLQPGRLPARSRSPTKPHSRRSSAEPSPVGSLAASPASSRPPSAPAADLADVPALGKLVLPPIAPTVPGFPSRSAEPSPLASPVEGLLLPSPRELPPRSPLPPRLSPQPKPQPHPPHRLQPLEVAPPDDGAGALPPGGAGGGREEGTGRRPREASVGGAARVRNLRAERDLSEPGRAPRDSPSPDPRSSRSGSLRSSPTTATPPRRALNTNKTSPGPLNIPSITLGRTSPASLDVPAPSPDAPSPSSSDSLGPASSRRGATTLEELLAGPRPAALSTRRASAVSATRPPPSDDSDSSPVAQPLSRRRVSVASPVPSGGSGSGSSRRGRAGDGRTLAAAPNTLDAAQVARVAAALRTDRKATSLRLALNPVGPEGAAQLAEALKVNGRLHGLDLLACAVGDAGAASLAEALRANGALRELNLARNGLGPAGARALASSLDAAAGLADFYARANGGEADDVAACVTLDVREIAAASGKRARALGKVLRRNAALQELYLYDNALGDEGVAALADALRSNFSVATLHAANVGMTDAGALRLAEALRENRALVGLNVRGNALGAAGLGAILAALRDSNRTLRALAFSPPGPADAAALAPLLADVRRACPELSLDFGPVPAIALPAPDPG